MSDYCRSCRAPVVWALTENGKWMPLDLTPNGDGEWRLFGDTPRAVHVPDPERRQVLALTGQLFMPHWATCPQAADWRERYR